VKITGGKSMKIMIGLSLTTALSVAAFAADNPEWAYPVTPPPGQLDNVTMKTVPGSSKQYTQAQIDDPFNPPDWFPDEHPPMPDIVAHGGPKPAGRACAQCHLPSGDGHPESASLAGLPANYIVRQMAIFKTGARANARAGVMIAMAQVFSDDEVKAAAGYFAKLKPTAGYNTVTETDTVAKSSVGPGGSPVSSITCPPAASPGAKPWPRRAATARPSPARCATDRTSKARARSRASPAGRPLTFSASSATSKAARETAWEFSS
jgi:cytochrome c553